MKVKIALATGMSLVFYSTFVHAYSQEEVNRVELPQEDAIQPLGENVQVKQISAKSEGPIDSGVAPVGGAISPEPIATKPLATVP